MLETLTGKTATLANFQRVRGMLRLLARTVAHVWSARPIDAHAIHLHHIDPGNELVRQEIVTRLGQQAYVPAIGNDIVAKDAGRKALAENIDAQFYSGMPPYTGYVARTVFMHTLAFNEPLKGIAPDLLRFSILNPGTDISFIEDARKRFMGESAYLDDRPTAPMRFLVEANLTQIIRREERNVDPGEVRSQLNDRIRQIFNGKMLDSIPFPGGPFDVPDEVGDGRPKLAVMSYDGVSIGTSVDDVPDLIARIFARKGADGTGLRGFRNNLAFVVVEEGRKDEMRRKTARRLALQNLRKPERLGELAEHQQQKVKEWEQRSEQELALAIQQCYRHVFYPSRNRVGRAEVDLAHSALDIHSTSDQPGAGQTLIVRALRDLNKLRAPEDNPDAPAYVRDKTPLKRGEITTHALREEFRKDPALPILLGDDIFVKLIRKGIELDEYVYRRGDLLCGQGDPMANIVIDEQSFVYTAGYAREKNIWPRPKEPAQPQTQPGAAPGGSPAGGVGDGSKGYVPPGAQPDVPLAGAFTAEGVLKEALTKLWEQARSKKVAKIGALTIRMFESGDAFKLMGAVGGVPNAAKRMTLTGGYRTRETSELRLEYDGGIEDAKPLKEFLEAQLRDASDKNLEASFRLEFIEGMTLDGDAPEKLTERLTRFASGAAYVSATAEAKA